MLRRAPRITFLLSCAALLVGVCAASAQNPSSSKGPIAYRWVDEQGVVHYGDHIPPQYANRSARCSTARAWRSGVRMRRRLPSSSPRMRASTPAQIRQRQHDAFLITTYTSVKDIEALRDVRLEQLRGQRTAAEQYVESLRSRLASLQTRALNFQPYSSNASARRMPDDLAENLVRTVNELDVQSRALASQGEEATSLRAQFQADIERYRALHTIHSQ